MDYKEKYENLVEAVKKLQEVNPSNEGIQNWINDNIPELKENGDEKIKKALIEHFAGAHSSMYPYKGFTKEQILAWIEKQGQQDKVKPKFHKGEWIVFNGLTLYIGEDKSFYGTTTKDGINNSYDWDIDNVARLWTIKDAKDGDVLFAENFDNIGGCVFLFKGLDSWKFDAEGDRSIATGYCCTSITESGNTDFGIQGPDCVEIKRVHPASKEQRDTLMKVMADAGYTFDFEKKELKKIEQKPTEWSEEDEQLYNDLSDTYFYNDEDYPEETYKLMLKRVLDWMNKRAKFLRPQSTWKPSEGQMELLREVQQALLGKDCHNRFVDFMYELKRLREE